MIWCTADVSPQETLTKDLALLSVKLLSVVYVIALPIDVENPDSYLALLSAPCGCPGTT